MEDDGNGHETTKTHNQSETLQHLRFSERCLHTRKCWEGGRGGGCGVPQHTTGGII